MAPLGLMVTALTNHWQGSSSKKAAVPRQQRLAIFGILQDRVWGEGILGLWRPS